MFASRERARAPGGVGTSRWKSKRAGSAATTTGQGSTQSTQAAGVAAWLPNRKRENKAGIKLTLVIKR